MENAFRRDGVLVGGSLFLLIGLLSCVSLGMREEREEPSFLAGQYRLQTPQGASDILADLKIEASESEEIVRFYLMVAAMSGCTGELAGEAKIVAQGKAVYSDEHCERLVLTLVDKGKVLVEETSLCHWYHGMRCSFEGVYQRVTDGT